MNILRARLYRFGKKIIDEIHGWWLTFEIMRDKELRESLRQAMKEIEEGKFFTREEVFGEEKDDIS